MAVRNRFLRSSARVLAGCVAILLMLALSGCGGKSSSTTTSTVTVTISPTSVSLAGNQTQQFTATVTGNSNTAVTWQAGGVNGGSTTFGTISTGGLYTAPVQVPNPNTVTVTAVSQADATKSASATVTITSSANIVVAPNSLVLPAGAQQTFTATVNSNPTSPVWTLHCASTATGACGTITSTGVYTAPLAPPPGGGVTITAAAPDNSAITGSVNITVTYSSASVSGPYAFGFTGQFGGKFCAETGSVRFDGNGNITSGTMDVHKSGAYSSVAITGGTYTIGADGRGTVTVNTANGPETWQFILNNHSHGVAVRTDSGVTVSGAFDSQDATKFALTALRGGYTLLTFGATASSNAPAAMAGGLLADGSGNIGNGTLDLNLSTGVSANLSATGTLTDPSGTTTGRGILTVNTSAGPQTFAFYVIDAGRMRVIETDGTQLTAGDLVSEPAVPFGFNNFSGNYVFSSALSSALGTTASAGTLTLNGNGGLTAGSADIAGSTLQTAQAITGTYSVPNVITGRSAAAFTIGGSAQTFALYPRADGGFNFLRLDVGNPAHGVAFAQPVAGFSTSMLNGNYTVFLAGATASGEADMAGKLTMTGGTAFTGTLAINDNGTVASAATFSGGAFAVNASGRGTATLTSTAPTLSGATMFIYIIDANRAVVLTNGGTRPLSGFAQFQF